MASRSKKPKPANPSPKNAGPSQKDAKPSPKNGIPLPKKKRSRLRRAIAALILGLVVPGVLLGLLEGSLRVLGYGYSTSFFVKNGEFLESNAQFGWRFFPRELSRSIGAIWMRQKRPPASQASTDVTSRWSDWTPLSRHNGRRRVLPPWVRRDQSFLAPGQAVTSTSNSRSWRQMSQTAMICGQHKSPNCLWNSCSTSGVLQ